jgi:hypothetical protein
LTVVKHFILQEKYNESCKTFYITGKIDEAEGTSVVAEIENLLCAATIEQQLHILKDVSKFLSTIILKCNDYVKREETFKTSPCKHQTFKMYGSVHAFLTSALVRDDDGNFWLSRVQRY